MNTSVLYAQNRIIAAFVSTMAEPDMVEIRLFDRLSRNREAASRFCILYGDKQLAEGTSKEEGSGNWMEFSGSRRAK